MPGWLSPGDRFELEKDANPEVKQAVCPAASLRLINNDKVVRLRVEATKAATAGKFDRAADIFTQMSTQESFEEFLTLPLYEEI